jgi:hypothetical protein
LSQYFGYSATHPQIDKKTIAHFYTLRDNHFHQQQQLERKQMKDLYLLALDYAQLLVISLFCVAPVVVFGYLMLGLILRLPQ